MKSLFSKVSFKTTAVCCLIVLSSLAAFSQQMARPNPKYKDVKGPKSFYLDAVFPVDNIRSITVTNFYGTHVLTKKELAELKQVLKKAKAEDRGNVDVKPGHISITIDLKDSKVMKDGWVYATPGNLYIEGGRDKFNKPLTARFHLPQMVNFDNYR